MGRFKKFIESEAPKSNDRKRDKTGNVFKRKKRNKRVYKSKISREDFLNKMKDKGATVSAYSLMDALNSKNKQVKNNIYDKKQSKNQKTNEIKHEFVDDSSEKEKEAMRNFVLSRYYEEELENEEDDIFTQKTLNDDKKDDIISF